MTKLNVWKMGCAVFLLCVAAAHAQIFTTMVSFDGVNGANPVYVSLIQGPDGNFFGTTSEGGIGTTGNVFGVTRDGRVRARSLYYGAYPVAGLVQATDGNFYGTTQNGGTNGTNAGTVFQVTPQGAIRTIYNFCQQPNCADGGEPAAALVQASDESLYGTAGGGGANKYGTIFRITRDGKLTVLHSFAGMDGALPNGALIQAADGNLYGTTITGGSSAACFFYNILGCGTIFRISPAGKFTTLYSFDRIDGSFPYGGLMQARDGKFYGTTSLGGTNNFGTVFQLTPASKLTTLHTFEGPDGEQPVDSLIQATDGNLYGTTLLGGELSNCPPYGCGTLFQMTTKGRFTTLHSFSSIRADPDGALPYGGLLQATNGTFYGTTSVGGLAFGTVFSLDMGLGPFVAFIRSYGKVGQTGGILGQGFTGTTSVSFNGTPAHFTVVSDTYLKATVPPGATTGYVTVTTPTGVLKSNAPFHVVQ